MSSTIAAAVDEQGAATQEISRNVQQAAQGTQQVSSHIADVQRGASETGSASSQVLSSAQSLSSGADNKLSNQKRFSDFMIDGVNCGPDGVRCDVNGNLWVASNAGRHVGYSGVTVWTPEGKLIGRIRLPEVCGNICFGGPKRNRLFMVASQSLYAVYTATQGAGPG
jgi:gluconolactonase